MKENAVRSLRKVTGMDDVKKVAWEIKSQLDAHEALGTENSYSAIVLRKALSVIEEQQEEIARLKEISKNGNGFIEKCDSRVAQMFSH